MTDQNQDRPSPEAFLREAAQEGRGRLKIFLGAAPGVGKTYEMLGEAAQRAREGTDVVIGVVETHGRAETEALVHGFEIVPRRQVEYRGRTLDEMDLDAILARRPQLALVDELAHTNAAGSRHDKRYQDVEELLAAGIDVYSTVNVQHLESLNDVIASFTKVRVRETLPDRVIEEAEIQVVDLPPDALIARLKQGKVYLPAEATRALGNYFSKSNLSALRELALRRAAQAIDAQMLDYLRAHALTGNWAAGERVLVAVSELPGSDALVRAGKRLADALRGSWTVVHIETPRSRQFGDADHARLASALHLATQLGAQVATVPAESVLEGLRRFAEESRATQLIVGKSARSRWFELINGSVVDRLVRGTPGITVHVLPMPASERVASVRPRRAPGAWGSATGYAVALLLTVLVTLLGVGIASSGRVVDVGLLYLVPVMYAATRHGLRTGLVTGVVASLAYNFFFIPPIHTFTIQDPANLVTVLVLLGVAGTSSQLAARLRDQALLARRSAAQNSSLAGFARQLTAAARRTEIAQLLCGEVARLLDVQTMLLLPQVGGLAIEAAVPAKTSLDAIEQAAARWAYEQNQAAGRGSDTLTAAEWLFQPVGASGAVLGVFAIARTDAREPIRSDQLPLLSSLIDQAALALERAGLEEEMAVVSRLQERDRLRSTLLSSVSHDLRTPLTTIIGMLGELRPMTEEQGEQIGAARSEAERLRRFVANLLDMARVEAGALTLHSEPVDLSDAVAAVLHELRRTLAGYRLEIDVPADLPLVAIDPQLFHQCLVNLLENAAKFAEPESEIAIRARMDGAGLAVDVLDQGPGLPLGAESRIFEMFARVEGSDRKGGTGLGLAIVKGFAEAMGLSVHAANRDGGDGARFTLFFPPDKLVSGEAGED